MSVSRLYFSVAAALLLGACASSPQVREMTLEPAVEATPTALARATFLTRACDWHAPRARIRRSETTDWKELPPPKMVSGEVRLDKTSTWEAPVTGSDAFRAGDSYDVQWIIPYTGSSILYDCPPEKSPRHVAFVQSYAITPAYSIAAAPASLELAPGSGATFDVALQRNAGFSTPVIATVTGLPAGITVTPPAVPIMETSRPFNIAVGANVAPGTYTADVRGTSPNRRDEHASLTVVVKQP